MRRVYRYDWVGLVVLVGGCGPVAGPGSEVATTTMATESASPTSWVGGTTVVSSETGAAAGTTVVVEPTAPNSEGSASSEVTGLADPGGTFIVRTDGGDPYDYDCDKFVQDCPVGEKCMPYANDEGSSWNDAKCVPVMEDPAQLDEPCFVVGNGVSGIDNCDLGLMCWDTDAENQGYCIAMCKGSVEMPYCEQPKAVCAITAEATLILCLPGCEPLEQDCNNDDLCVPDGEQGFICVLDASADEGQVHDPCMYLNACDPGLLCAGTASAVECDPASDGCCEPFCEFGGPNTCPGAGQVCLQYLVNGEPVPDYEYVGVCGVPM